MAFRINQTFLLGLLCIALVLDSGLALPGLACRKGPCKDNSQCAQSCVDSGYKNGGSCIGVVPGIIICCCHK
uniref:Uncharacterized protein n=1 Tax=Cajanus cajan TaxID=3821 RepID=A0A151QNW1_CAJCA|nr:hypothetical protein KK1_047464 [Cajanus cajan]